MGSWLTTLATAATRWRGAKLLYQLGHLGELWTYLEIIFASPRAFLDYLGAGFVFYGGLMGGAVGVIVYARFFRQNTVALAESFVPGIPLFHCFGRLGCFMAGCCYGVVWDGPLENLAKAYISEEKGVADAGEALDGAKDIIAEFISDEAKYRTWIRKTTTAEGRISSKAKDEKAQSVYEMYYDLMSRCPKWPVTVLAINRGENEKLLVIKVEAPEEKILSWLERQIITCLQKRSDRTYG